MKSTVSEHDFTQAFVDMNRGDNFSPDGRVALFDYLEQLEEDIGEEFELDVIALCCEYCEYETLAKYNQCYGTEHESIEEVENDTTVIPIDDESFIIQAY